MDFLLHHDWWHRGAESDDFITEEVLAGSNLHRILSGSFRDPLISDEDSDEDQQHDIDALLQNFKNKNQNNTKNNQKPYIAGLRPLPVFPRKSSLSPSQHELGVRVLAAAESIHSGGTDDSISQAERKEFEQIQEVYLKEQKEFRTWAKQQWSERHCIRALHILPVFERVYEADWSVRMAALASLPVDYEYAAQISMSSSERCQMEHLADLKKVHLSKLPILTLPPMDTPCSVAFFDLPEPMPRVCRKHPCRIVLPEEDRNCQLPLSGVHKELAKFALKHDVTCIVSEAALRTMVQTDTAWNVAVTVQQLETARGPVSVLVVSDLARPHREEVQCRVERALHLLLAMQLRKLQDMTEDKTEEELAVTEVAGVEEETCAVSEECEDASSSDDDENLCIDLGDDDGKSADCDTIEESSNPDKMVNLEASQNKKKEAEIKKKASPRSEDNKLGNVNKSILTDECTCKGTPYEKPPHTSYQKWLLKKDSENSMPIIVHCSHKHRKDERTECVSLVTPEFQLELGAAAASSARLRGSALALRLRRDASLLSARIDANKGLVVKLQYIEEPSLMAALGDGQDTQVNVGDEAVSIIYETFSQLSRLKPNQYVLQHEPHHGENALLFVASQATDALHTLSLAVDKTSRDDKETKSLKVAPELSTALLPAHRTRSLLPLAFHPNAPPHNKSWLHNKKQQMKEQLMQAKQARDMKKRQKLKMIKKKRRREKNYRKKLQAQGLLR